MIVVVLLVWAVLATLVAGYFAYENLKWEETATEANQTAKEALDVVERIQGVVDELRREQADV